MVAMARTRKVETLLELCVARAVRARGGSGSSIGDAIAAMPKGVVGCGAVVLWAIATRELGHLPTTVEFAEWWRISERQAWRYRANVHELFPGNELAAIVEHVAGGIDELPAGLDRRQALKLAAKVKLSQDPGARSPAPPPRQAGRMRAGAPEPANAAAEAG